MFGTVCVMSSLRASEGMGGNPRWNPPSGVGTSPALIRLSPPLSLPEVCTLPGTLLRFLFKAVLQVLDLALPSPRLTLHHGGSQRRSAGASGRGRRASCPNGGTTRTNKRTDDAAQGVQRKRREAACAFHRARYVPTCGARARALIHDSEGELHKHTRTV